MLTVSRPGGLSHRTHNEVGGWFCDCGLAVPAGEPTLAELTPVLAEGRPDGFGSSEGNL